MQKLLFLLLSASFFCCKKSENATPALPPTKADTIASLIKSNATTFIVLRHAERENTGTDPVLNADGIARANELKNLLNSIPVNAVYTTPFNRTRQTVTPLASAKSITVSEYQITEPYADLLDGIEASNYRKVVVVAGHSNTVPEILKVLSGNSFNVTISESQYDNLFIASQPDGGNATVTALKYGKVTP